MSRFAPANDDQGDEEWKELHKDDPVERVREPVDNRSLFEKLQEQKAAKEDAYNEATKFSNLIRRLDNDEIDFLASVREQKQKEEERKKREQDAAIDRFRSAQKTLDAATRNSKPDRTVAPKIKDGFDLGEDDSRKRRKPNVMGIVKKGKPRTETTSALEEDDLEVVDKDITPKTKRSDETVVKYESRLGSLVDYDSESD